MAWPIVARRLEGMPNISAMQLFDELCIQFPGRFTPRQYPALLRRVNRWREDARERGVWVGTETYRVFNDKWSGRKRDIFADHWKEMVECLEEHPDQTALELLVEFQARYPGTAKGNCIPCRSGSEPGDSRQSRDSSMRSAGLQVIPPSRLDGNIAHEASGNKIT